LAAPLAIPMEKIPLEHPPVRDIVAFRSDLPGSESEGSQKNVQLLARNRVVTAMAGPDRIPGRWTRKKILATAAAAR
jgi:hypothetical protein